MAGVLDQQITDRWAVYNGDCLEVMASLPAESMHLSVYSPPFATESGGALYHYSSSDRDLSNARTYAEFLEHYGYVIEQMYRLTLPGRISAVHCKDVPLSNTGRGDTISDFPGDIIRLHRKIGFGYAGRRTIWKEPLAERNRTLTKGLAHRTIVDDSTQSMVANADYLITFRKRGDNLIPVTHPTGLMEYAGARKPPAEVLKFRGWTGDQKLNRYSHWIWRQYASSVWGDIRGNQGDRRLDEGSVLPYRESREEEDEKHVHPLQLDVITRAVVLYTNPAERVFTPFMGVGSEVYEPVRQGRYGLGAELKPAYYRQTLKNLAAVDQHSAATDEPALFESEPGEVSA
jgi:DNA modification methylase